MTHKERDAREEAILDHAHNCCVHIVRNYRDTWAACTPQHVDYNTVHLAARMMAERDFLKRELQQKRTAYTKLKKEIVALADPQNCRVTKGDKVLAIAKRLASEGE